METAWQFFSDPANLATMTPPWLKFRFCSPLPERMFAGLIVEYRITLPPGPPMRWVTEITHVEPLESFVDEQRFGPYRFWHHLHRFTPVDGGILMEDVVHYQLPLAPLGDWLMGWWIKRRLESIFNFRYRFLQEKFSGESSPGSTGKRRRPGHR